MPCILDIITSEDTCFETVERWRHEQSLLTYLFRWSQDGNQLSFITLYDRSLLCTVALTTEDITCVAEASDIVVDDIQLRRFLSHGLLSNSCYLFAVLDTEEPGVGWVGSTYLAVASVEGTDFRVLGRMEFSSNPLPRP